MPLRPGHAPRNVYVREDHLLETLAGQLHQDNGPRDFGECLRRRGLEIVCRHKGRELQPAAVRKIVSLPVSSGQTALAFDWNLNTGAAPGRRAESAEGRHGVFLAGAEKPLSSGCGAHGPVFFFTPRFRRSMG